MGISTLKCWHFEASKDLTKFKSQALHIIKTKYVLKLVGVATLLPSFPPSRKLPF